ncbi:hypothetical protein L207DRAFT_59129 [Hyaloscypha variabilis F]|uniref:Zn(2)-C6 fungal-type domain-containing protein n=1 Tax=Hyaloscypha variabilis (strain UAMH 11265 / GT02V1 / F) TaxID=1149755 RepID=A0A2J6RHD1_HYAVF|nr:hypothetical protein L207DRAFT_59129 [Hyaloscypha variabilis F]
MPSGQIRASKPKVRTGCRRCKARRVKCDETKPQCLRCIQYGRPCTGYESYHPPISRVDSRSTQLAPRTTPFNISVPLEQPAPVSLLGGQTEHQYFHYFRTTTAAQLCDGFEDEVWNRIVLQASHSIPSLQRLVISIGALSRSRELQTDHSSSKEAILALDKYALDEYSQALKGIQTLAKTPSSTLNITRLILIASILIYVFESFHGNTSPAIAYLKSALAIALRNKPRTGPILYRHLGTNLLSRDIEDELITAFARLDGQLAHRYDNPDPTIPTVLGMRMDYYDELYVVPSQFFDTQTARRYLEHIQYRSRPNVERQDSASEDGESTQMGKSEEVTLFKEETRRMVSVREMEGLKEQQRKWMGAFQPLYEKIYMNPRDGSWVAVKILRFQGLQTYLLLYGPLRIRLPDEVVETKDEVLEGVCAEMLGLAREVVSDERFTRGFMFNYGLIPGLLVVILSAPRKETGWEAVRVLGSMRGRVEGTWDSEGVAKMGEGILIMQGKG